MKHARLKCMPIQGTCKSNFRVLEQGCHNSPLLLKILSSEFSFLYYGISEDSPVLSSLGFSKQPLPSEFLAFAAVLLYDLL